MKKLVLPAMALAALALGTLAQGKCGLSDERPGEIGGGLMEAHKFAPGNLVQHNEQENRIAQPRDFDSRD